MSATSRPRGFLDLARGAVRRGRADARAAWVRLARVRHRSPATNVYHCCVQKTASQWLRKILGDVAVYRYSGLRLFHYQSRMAGGFDPRPLAERRFEHPFPARTIVSPLYIDYAGYRAIPRSGATRSFFVMRDPRDVLVSWYFSVKHSHGAMGQVTETREALRAAPLPEGLRLTLDRLEEQGLFRALGSWADAAARDETLVLLRFEDLVSPDGVRSFRALFEHLGIAVPEPALLELMERYSFDRLSGRRPGEEDRASHYRKGTAGDWRNHFDPELCALFARRTGDLAERLGYG